MERYHATMVQSSRSGGRMLVASTLRQTFGLRLRLNQPTARIGRFIRLPYEPTREAAMAAFAKSRQREEF